jgi:regulatory LuxR family protein
MQLTCQVTLKLERLKDVLGAARNAETGSSGGRERVDIATIAARLNISIKTVRNQVSTIFSKIGVTTRAQAVAFARDAGWRSSGT